MPNNNRSCKSASSRHRARIRRPSPLKKSLNRPFAKRPMADLRSVRTPLGTLAVCFLARGGCLFLLGLRYRLAQREPLPHRSRFSRAVKSLFLFGLLSAASAKSRKTTSNASAAASTCLPNSSSRICSDRPFRPHASTFSFVAAGRPSLAFPRLPERSRVRCLHFLAAYYTHCRPNMTELVWDGKYKDGKKQGPLRIALPVQTIETVNESAHDRTRDLDHF